MEHWPLTQHSLLVRIRDASDHEAWCRFVDTYGPVFYGYSRRQGLKDADAADVTQDIMRRVCGAVGEFRYDSGKGTFRGWLFTIARNALRNFLTAAARRERGSGDTQFQQLLGQLPDVSEDSRIWDEEYERQMLAVAAENIKNTFAEQTWQAFWQTTVEDRTVKEVAETLGISVGAIYVAKSRVLARLRQEVERLEAEVEMQNG